MKARPLERPRDISIGALSKHTGVNIESIRYYERIGILPAAPRSQGGHRLYPPDQVKRLRFIRRSRQLGFSLEEIRTLLRLVDGGDYTCAEVKVLTEEHLGSVRRKIADLRGMERVLKEMIDQCSGDIVPECPIIEALSKERIPALT